MNQAFAQTSMHVGVQTGAWDAVVDASPVVKLTLLALVSMSVMSWGIIFAKRKQFQRIRKANSDFLDVFFKAGSLEEVYENFEKYKTSPLAFVFRAGFIELQKIASSNLGNKLPSFGNATTASVHATKLAGLDNLVRALRKAGDIEVSLLEARMNFLATTGSTGPFIGLFGTVWGIMGAFQKIGATGSASLAVVAPGISEALITTAIGLVAAIPAVVFYNTFVTDVRKQELEISNFSSDYINIVKRNFFKDE